MKLYVTDQNGTTHEIEGEDELQLMEAIRDADLPIKAECGGSCACATCHVYVDPACKAMVGEADEDEQDMLDLAFELTENSRLSCQIVLGPQHDGLKVTLAPGSEID